MGREIREKVIKKRRKKRLKNTPSEPDLYLFENGRKFTMTESGCYLVEQQSPLDWGTIGGLPFFVNEVEVGVRAGLEQSAGFARAAAIGEAIFCHRIFAEQHFGPFAGGFEPADALRAGEDICVRRLAGGKGTLQD